MPLPRRRKLIGSSRQPHRKTPPVEVGFAPAGKRFEIIGAVDEVSPFPVANSSETTPCEAAEEGVVFRPTACIRKGV